MGIQYAKSFLLETLNGVHNFSSDTVKAALFSSAASFTQDTAAYAATNEISVAGYTAAGSALVLSAGYPMMEGPLAAVRYVSPVWDILAPTDVRWVLIYNASKSNRAIVFIDMGSVQTIYGEFTVNFPLSAPPLISQRAPSIS